MNVGSLQRNYRVGEAKIFQDSNVTHGGFDHGLRRRGAIFFQQILLK
jgi:hypothetical protein